MPSTFFGLEIGLRGLMTQQQAINVTGQNMTNSATPGYSRQTAVMTTTDPYPYPGFNQEKIAGQMGTGVQVTSVIRATDQLLNQQVWQQTTSSGFWSAQQDILGQAEQIVNEPGDSNIRSDVDNYWTQLEKLAGDPSNSSLRTTVIEATKAMTDGIRQSYASLQNLREAANTNVVNKVTEINQCANQIADLNKQIGQITALGQNANDLMDKRDLLIEKVSKDINCSVTTDNMNKVTISVNGISLVNGDDANNIKAIPDPSNDKMVKLQWTIPAGQPVTPASGALIGYLQTRDEDVPQTMDELNNFAQTLITQTNAIYKNGYDMNKQKATSSFFSGNGAADIDLADALKDPDNGPNLLAASADQSTTGNGDIIKSMLDVKTTPLMNNNTVSIEDYLGALVAELGAKSQTAQDKVTHQTALLSNLDSMRQSISGVNTDEEATYLVKYQNAYNAASKIITTQNAMLDVIINGLKVTA